MSPLILKFFFILSIFLNSIIRSYYEKQNKFKEIEKNNKTTLEKILLFLVFLGMFFIPVVYVFGGARLGFSYLDYVLPFYLQVLGIILVFPGVWFFYRSHKDLGKNWSVSLEIRKEHNLIDFGIYKYIRHPMYSSIWIWVISQALLLNNYIAGLSGVICFGILYFLRIEKEEKMMIEQFGDEYENYKKRTKRLIPFII